MRKGILTYLLAVLMPVVASAQALPFVSAEYAAGALAKAGAVSTETRSTAMAAFGNVAGVTYSESAADFKAGYTSWQPNSVGTSVLFLGGSYNLDNKLGFALGLTSGSYDEYEIFNDSGSSKGTFKPSDFQLNVGAAYRVLPFLSAGVNLGYASSSLAESVSYGAFKADIFLMSKFDDLKVALGVADLGSAVVSASDAKFSLPSALKLGVGYDMTFADVHKVDVALDADYYFAGAAAAAVGAEYIFNDMISVCAGYRYGGDSIIPSYASVGIGGRLYGVSLELAYILPSNSSMSDTLSLAVGYSF